MDFSVQPPNREGRLYVVAEKLERFIEGGQIWVAVIAALALFLLQVPGVESLFSKLGLENSQHLRTIVSLLLLLSILFEIRQLKKQTIPSKTEPRHYSDPSEMYAALTKQALGISDSKKQSLDVLGLTLFSAWPTLSFMLQRSDVNNWEIRLATLSATSQMVRGWVPDDWPSESAANVRQVKAFAEGDGQKHGHRIHVYEYDFVPVVHGFRLGNGDIFVSTLLWQKDGRLGKPGFTYDHISAADTSEAATAARRLFANWFDRALASSGEGNT